MTLEPTRGEWMAARARVREAVPANYSIGMDELVHAVTTAALGPCPPEPAPDFVVRPVIRPGRDELSLRISVRRDEHDAQWVGLLPGIWLAGLLYMDAETAQLAADALVTCANWLEEHGDKP